MTKGVILMDKEKSLFEEEISKLELACCEAEHNKQDLELMILHLKEEIDQLKLQILIHKKDIDDMTDKISTVKNLLKGY